MYGYVQIYKPELKFREYDVYRGYYCGLCGALHQRYGMAARWTLSYDMTFLVLLLDSLYEPEETRVRCRCGAHPFQKQLHISSEASAYGADMSVLLFREKCMDDWLDEKKLSRRAAAGILQGSYQKAAAIYPEKAKFIADQLEQLHQMEQVGATNPDLPAGCFGTLLGELFAWKPDMWEPTLRQIGFYLGKYIYLLDAYDDLERDRKKGCYNPFLKQGDTDAAALETACQNLLELMIGACADAFERLPLLRHAEILRNILYAGVWTQFRQIREKRAGLAAEQTGSSS